MCISSRNLHLPSLQGFFVGLLISLSFKWGKNYAEQCPVTEVNRIDLMIIRVRITKMGIGSILVSFSASLSSICLCSLEECEEGGGRWLGKKQVASVAQRYANGPVEEQP